MCVLVFSSSHFTLGPYSIRFVQRGAVKKAYHALISPNMPLRLSFWTISYGPDNIEVTHKSATLGLEFAHIRLLHFDMENQYWY